MYDLVSALIPFLLCLTFIPYEQPKYSGLIIDIVSRDTRTPEQQAEALVAVKNAVLDIVLIVVLGYGQLHHCFSLL